MPTKVCEFRYGHEQHYKSHPHRQIGLPSRHRQTIWSLTVFVAIIERYDSDLKLYAITHWSGPTFAKPDDLTKSTLIRTNSADTPVFVNTDESSLKRYSLPACMEGQAVFLTDRFLTES
jgi:hypothetical protein